MAFLRLRRADAVIFQVVRRNLAGMDDVTRQWKEHKVFAMAVKPASLQYSEASRSTLVQTSPDAGFVDRFGSRLIRVAMSGTFGLQVRRQGLLLKDGYTRLIEFRDEVFRLSQSARPKKTDGGAVWVYAVNFYDFINDEKFAVNLDTFSRSLDARRNPFEPVYDLSFTGIGEPIKVIISRDPLLNLLNATDAVFDAVESAIDSVLDSEIAQTVSGVAEVIEALAQTSEGLSSLALSYSGAVTGQLSSATFGGTATGRFVNKTLHNILQVKG